MGKSIKKYLNQGNLQLTQRNPLKAISCYKKALSFYSYQSVVWNNLGTAYLGLKKYAKAKTAYQKALRINPAYPAALYGLGLIAKIQGELVTARKYFEKSLQFNPLYVRSYLELGKTLRDFGESRKAIVVLSKAIGFNPTNFELQYLLATVLRDTDQHSEAIKHYRLAARLNPTHARVWGDLATVLIFQNKLIPAQKILKKAISLDPSLPYLYFNLAMAYKTQNRPQKAIILLRKILELEPDYQPAVQALYFIKREICDWRDMAQLEKLFDKKNCDGHYISILRSDNLAENLKVARARSLELEKSIPWQRFAFGQERKKAKAKIRLGYVSRDFRSHPVGQMVTPIFAYHNRKKFEVFVFAAGEDDQSPWRKLAEKAEHFFDLGPLTHLETAKFINNKKIDILIDTTGPMTHNPMVASALKPAPVQVSWMGVLGTSGASFYDYVIGDRIVTPFKERNFYTEKIVQLPCFSWINGPRPKIRKKFTKADFGLPADRFVFAALCLPQKIDLEIWKVWMSILKRVPKSILWLWRRYDEVEKNLKFYAEKEGVNPKRLVFFEKLPLEEHLQRIKLADLVLDTYIYQGAQTSSSILGSSAPLLTTLGNHYIGRITTSMLYKLGVPELVTKNLKEYENRAVFLAQNQPSLQVIKNKILERERHYSVKEFIADLEKAYLKIWQNYLDRKMPQEMII